jgi:hypothetical protein
LRGRAPSSAEQYGRIVRADPTPAWTAWSALDEQTQREVGRLAQLGRRHPDGQVAVAARDWARILLASADEEDAKRGRRRVGLTVVVLLSLFWEWGPPILPEGNTVRGERVWALKVLRADAAGPEGLRPAVALWTAEQRRRQLTVLVPVLLCLAAALTFVAVLATRS